MPPGMTDSFFADIDLERVFCYNEGVNDSSLALLIVVAILLVLALWLWQRGRRAEIRSFSSDVTRRASMRETRREMWDTLTLREMEVARCVIQGLRNAEIAKELTVSVSTVESHLAHIYTKLKIHSRVELMRVLRDLED
jgi:DNA-binding NarL/FixJ family response regulator